MAYSYYLGKTTKLFSLGNKQSNPKRKQKIVSMCWLAYHQTSFHLGHLEALRESVLSEHALKVWVRRRECKSEG